MLIPIYYGKRHTFTLRGRRVAEIICPHCDHPFRLEDAIGASGKGFSILGLADERAKQTALAAAVANLASSLPDLSPAPCPNCQQFHPAMNGILRWLFWQKVLFGGMAVAVALAIGAMLIFLKMTVNERLTLAAVGALPLLFLVYRYRKDLKLAPVTLSSFTPTEGAPKLRIGIQFNGETEMHWHDIHPAELEGNAILQGARTVGRFGWTALMVIGGLFTFSGLVPCMLFIAVHVFKYRTTDKPPTLPMLLVYLLILIAGIGMLALGTNRRRSS